MSSPCAALDDRASGAATWTRFSEPSSKPDAPYFVRSVLLAEINPDSSSTLPVSISVSKESWIRNSGGRASIM